MLAQEDTQHTTWRPAADVEPRAEAAFGAGPGLRVPASHEVALDVREQAFLDHYFTVVEAFPVTGAPE